MESRIALTTSVLRRSGAEIALLLMCLFLFFWRLGDTRLFDLDEGLYVTCARQMVASGDYIVPRLNVRPHLYPANTTVPFFEKPAMVYWLSAASMRLFGISEFAARLPVALASSCATLLVAWFGRRWFGRRAGLLAAVVYATAPMTVIDARQMTTDALLVLWFTVSMVAYWEAWPVVFWISCGLAVLTKGAVGLLFPGMVITALSAARFVIARRSGLIQKARTSAPGRRVLKHVFGIALFLLIVVPWHVAVWKAGGIDSNGRSWVAEYLVRQHVGRFKGKDTVHNAPLPTYFAYFLIGFFPWACFTPFAFRRRDLRPERERERQEDSPSNGRTEADLVRFLLCWFWTIFVFFSLSAAKLPTYIVPIYPAAALLVGRWLDRQFGSAPSGAEGDRGAGGTSGLVIGSSVALGTSLLLLVATLAVPYVTRQRPVMPEAGSALAILLTLTTSIGCFVAWLCFRRAARASRWTIRGAMAQIATMLLLFGLIAGPGYAVAARWIFGPCQDMAAAARSYARTGAPVVFYAFGDRRATMLYYARDYSPFERKETPLLPFLTRYLPPDRQEAGIITVRKTFEKQLQPELRAAHWNTDLIALSDDGLQTWIFLRIYRQPETTSAVKRVGAKSRPVN